MQALWNPEIAVTLFFQNLGGWLVLPMKIFSMLGQEEFFLAVVPLIYWCFDAIIGLRVGMMLMVTTNPYGFFKLAFHFPRPYWITTQVHAYLSESSFSFPSGHAQGAASTWGILAASIKRRWFTVTILVVIFLIGLSRIVLGVHFASDVLAGWLIGALLTFLFARFERPVLAKFQRLKFGSQIGTLFIGSLLMVLIYFIALLSLNGWVLPEAWVTNALAALPGHEIDPLNPSSAFTTAGTFFGMTAGAVWLLRYRPDFQFTTGSQAAKALRYFVGILGMLVIYYGLGRLFPRELNMVSYSLRYLRHALLGFYVSALAPLLFARIGLTRPSERMMPAAVEGK